MQVLSRSIRPLGFLMVFVLLAPMTRGALAQEAACPDDLEILVERPFARSVGLEPGDRVPLRAAVDSAACDARVAGLFEPAPDPSRLTIERPRILLHLPHLAALVGRDDEVDHFTVRLTPEADPYAIAAELEALVPGTRALATSDVAERASTTFLVVSRFHRAIGFITLVAGGVFLSCIMVLKVQERRTPIAAARLVGIPRRTLLAWTIGEATALSTLGGIGGVGLGLGASRMINAVYQRVYDTRLVFSSVTPETIMQALGLAIALGAAAGVLASYRLVRADALREVGR